MQNRRQSVGFKGDIMVTQKQIKDWLPTAIEIFQRFMPPTDVPFPSVHIISDKTVFLTRAKLVEKV